MMAARANREKDNFLDERWESLHARSQEMLEWQVSVSSTVSS